MKSVAPRRSGLPRRAARGHDGVVLVGRSLGGFTVPMVAQALGDVGRPPRGIVLVNAMIPVDPLVAAAREHHQQPEADAVFGSACDIRAWPDVPTRVIAGADDRFFPLGLQQRVARERLGIEPRVVPGGHLVALSEPQQLAHTCAEKNSSGEDTQRRRAAKRRAHCDHERTFRRHLDGDLPFGNHRRMAMTATLSTEPAADVERLDAAACLFHGFSDPSRLAILRHLALGEHRVTDLTAHIGLAQSTVSKHLACLRDCGLVISRPEGRASMFSLTHPEALNALFAAAEQLLGLTGDAVTLCVNYGADALPTDAR